MRYFLICCSFFITALGQPARIGGFGVLAAVCGYALFWHGILRFQKKRDRFLIATFWFAAVQGVQLSWLATPDYMGPLIVPFYLFLILGIGLQFGILSSFIDRNPSWHKCFAIAGGWVLCEGSRLFFLCGCTWNPVGLALASSPYSVQFASICGIFGLSFWVILVNLSLLKKKALHCAALALFPYLFGLVHQTVIEKTTPISKTLEVALVQTNLAPEQKELLSKARPSFVQPLEQWSDILSVLGEKQSLDLIILPEAALPWGAHAASYDLDSIKMLLGEEFFPPLAPPYALFFRGEWKVSNAFIAQTIANQYNAHVVIGLDDRDESGKYNAAFHYLPGNLPPCRYEKQILAPMGEYIPFGGVEWFSRFVRAQFGIYGSFDRGKEGKIFNAQVPIGISICLEETFTSLIRELRVKGAELFVSVSNDAYFPNTKLGRQHFDHGRVRAAENGVALLRSSNAGITCVVDCFGNATKILESKKRASALFCSLPLRSYKTLYTLWGDTAIFGLSLLLILSFLIRLEKKKLP